LPVTAIPLAEVYVAAGSTFIATADITDVRAPSSSETFTVRSNFEVLTTAERDALTPYVGQAIFNSTTSQVEVWDGSQWQPVVGASLASLSDVDLAGLQDGDILVYDLASGDWLASRQRAVEDDQQIIAVSVFA
jgi:hypothetical protein